MEWDSEDESKVFNDPIHGSVELPLLLIKIIDTPQFQRLRNIKQLGGGYFVYPGASHNRFEHSIGVAHLAGELAKTLKTRQPELKIMERDILCVQIAGLCHDLGHGPFSHLFDQQFIPNAERPPGALGVRMENWTHEEASKEMFDYMVESNGLEDEMKNNRLKLPKDTDFIKEMIAGPTKAAQGQEVLPNDADFIKGVIAGPTKAAQGQEVLGINTAHWPYKGRPKKKSFLYEIVANKRNGIDVDKFDYLARDCYYLGIQNNFDYRRFLKFVRVCEVDGQMQICTRDKEVGNLYDMFHTRYCLHRRVCQHKVNIIIQHMIAEAFLKADKHIKIKGSGVEDCTLSTAIFDMKAYTKLTDAYVFEQILNSPNKDLEGAKQILENITNRRLYKYLGKIQADDMSVKELKEMIPRWKKELAQPILLEEDGLTPEDFEVLDSIMDYGMKDKNPINEMRFYKKESPDEAFEIPEDEKSMFLPVCYSEKLIRVYYRKIDDESMEAARKHFNNVEQKGWPKAARDTVTPELTPGENVENDLSN